MVRSNIFRREALEARNRGWLGEIIIVRPALAARLTVACIAITGGLLALLLFGSYTKRTSVSGQLVPDAGLIKVYAPQYGVVVKKMVMEGQIVKKGEVLYTLSGERQIEQGNPQAAISQQVSARQQSLREEMQKMLRLEASETKAMRQKVVGLQSELVKLSSQIESQRARVKIAEDAAARWFKLASQHYISQEQLQQKEADLLEQRSRLQSLERDSISTSRDLSSQQAELASMPLRHQNQLSEIERALMSTRQEFVESESKRTGQITAPIEGTAAAVYAEIGQAVDAGRPLLSLIPKGSDLQAHLYAPSRSIGFVSTGDQVLLRYHAFPYQKFGHARGTVIAVSRTALQTSEIAAYGGFTAGQNISSEPLYRITVKLNSQTVSAYGRAQRLQPGMLVDADIMQETRRLYEWVLEPLYSLTGKL
jgi:membrane fusion protein